MLDDVQQWKLAPSRWERVDHILDTIVGAVAATDLATLLNAITELELAGPVRVLRIGAGEVVSIPESVRDRVNHLVHTLRTGEESPPPPPRRDPADSPGDPGDAH